MKLPEINPASPVSQGAESLVQAGKEFGAAAGEWAKVLHEERKTDLLLQTEKAATDLHRTRQDVVDLIRANPVVSPAAVRELFGGQVPANIEEQLADPVTKAPKPYVLSSAFADALYEKRMREGLDQAASGIDAPGFQDKFRVVAEKDILKGREEVLDWARGQKLAMNSLKAESAFNDAVAMRNWEKASRILNDPAYGLDPKVAEKLRGDLPRIQVISGVEDRLRSSKVKDIEAAIADVASNNFPVKLNAQEQFEWQNRAENRLNHLVALAEHREAKAYEARWQREVAQPLERINNIKDPAERQKAANDFALPVGWLKYEQFAQLEHFRKTLAAGQEVVTSLPAWANLSSRAENGTLHLIPWSQFTPYVMANMSPTDAKTWMDRRAKAEEDATKGSLFSEEELKHMATALRSWGYDDDPKDPKKRAEFFEARAMLERTLAPRREPGKKFDYAQIAPVVQEVHNLRKKGVFSDNITAPFMKDLTPGGRSELMNLYSTLNPGGGVNVARLTDLWEEYKKMEPDIRAAWEHYNPEQDFNANGLQGITVFGMIRNPATAPMLQKQVSPEQRENVKALIDRAVLNMQDPRSRAGAAVNEERIRREVERRQLGGEAQAIRETQKNIKASEEKAWMEKPYEVRGAWTRQMSAFDAAADDERRFAAERGAKEVEAARPSGAGVITFNNAPVGWSPPKELLDRLEKRSAELEKSIAARREEFRKSLEADMKAYEAYLAERPGSLNILRFEDWRRTR